MPSRMTRFESLLEAVPDALVGMDQQGVIRFVNRQTEALFGYDRDDIVGRRIEMLVPERLWQIYAEHKEDYFADLRTRSSGVDLVLSGKHQDGTDFPVNLSMSHIDTGDVLLVFTAVQDVTEQKQAVEAAQLIAAVVQFSDDAIIGGTLDGIITSWNPAAERMYGYAGREIIGRSASLLLPPERAGELVANLSRVGQGQTVERLETIRVRKDGTRFPVSLTVAPIRDEEGVIVGVSAVHRDVTEQRAAFELGQRMEAIVEGSDDAIIGRTLDGIITSWNPAAERMYGYRGEEVIGQSVALLIPQDRTEEMNTILAGIRSGQPVERLETIRIRKDGTVFPISLTVSPVRGADGAVVGASVICRDMTEQEHAAQYARSLIEAGPDPLVTISPEGNIDDVNEATVELTGVAREKLIGTDFSQYFTDPDKAREIHRRAFAQGSVTDYPLSLRHRDGTVTDVLYNASVYRDTSGSVLGVLAAARDMTTQKEAFEAAQRMAAIVEYSDDAIIGQTLEGIVTSWNPAAERLYGYPAKKIVGRSVDLLSPKDRSGEIGSILARIKAGLPVDNFETICQRKDRTTFPVKLTVAPIRGVDGAVVGASAIARDVTGQRQALAAAQRMAAIVEFSGEAIVGGTPEGIVTSWNPAAERLFGYSTQEVIGKSIELLSPKGRAGEINSLLARVRDGEAVEDFGTGYFRKDGTVVPVSITITPIRDADGAVTGVSSIVRDVTAQRQAERFARVAAAIEFSGEAIISQTLEGIVTSWNPAAERMFGYSSEEMVGRSGALVIPEDRTGEVGDIMAKIRAGEQVESLETTRARKDGSVFPISLTITPIRDADGVIVGASSTPYDITRAREAFETVLQMAAIVENSADAIIGQTLDGIVTSWNPAAERTYGYSSQEIIGRSVELLSPEGRTGEITAMLARIKAGQLVEHHETMRARKDGTAIRVSLTVSPIRGANGAIVGAAVIHRELAEQQ